MTADSRVAMVSPDAQGWWEQSTPRTQDTPGAQWCTVRVQGPRGALDVALPALSTVAELVEELSARLMPGAPLGRPGETWYLHRLGRRPFNPSARLGDSGVADGETLHLSRFPMPRPAQLVDDGLVALAEGASGVGRWGPRPVGVLAAVGTVLASTVAVLLALVVGAGLFLPVVLAAGLLALSLQLRGSGRGDDLPALGAALATLPAWAGTGLAVGLALDDRLATVMTLIGAAVAVGSALAATVLPWRAPWWGFGVAAGVSAAAVHAVIARDLLTMTSVTGVVATVWVVLLVVAPWLVTRSRTWLEADPVGEDELAVRGARARRTLDAIAIAGSAAVAACVLALALPGDPLALGLGGTLGAVLLLRARRSRFVVESGAELAGGAFALGAVALVLVRDGGPDIRIPLLVAAAVLVAAMLALGVAARSAAAGDDGWLSWWSRPRTRRTLNVLEVVAAVAVLPLLAGVLGIYTAAANAGAGL